MNRKPYIDITQPNVFLDWETLDTVATAKVLSLGVAVVQPHNLIVEPLGYWNIVDSPQLGRTVSKRTVAWWKDQMEKTPALEKLLADTQLPLRMVLAALIQELEKLGRPYYLWGNGADFDCAILWHAVAQMDFKLPHWSYQKTRCFRQLRSMYPNIQQPAFEGHKHHALYDAMHEAEWFVKILREAGYVQ